MSPMHKIMKTLRIKRSKNTEKGRSRKRTPTPRKACDPIQIPNQQNNIHRLRCANSGSRKLPMNIK